MDDPWHLTNNYPSSNQRNSRDLSHRHISSSRSYSHSNRCIRYSKEGRDSRRIYKAYSQTDKKRSSIVDP